MHFRIERETEANMARGMSPDAAHRAARLPFGSVDAAHVRYAIRLRPLRRASALAANQGGATTTVCCSSTLDHHLLNSALEAQRVLSTPDQEHLREARERRGPEDWRDAMHTYSLDATKT